MDVGTPASPRCRQWRKAAKRRDGLAPLEMANLGQRSSAEALCDGGPGEPQAGPGKSWSCIDPELPTWEQNKNSWQMLAVSRNVQRLWPNILVLKTGLELKRRFFFLIRGLFLWRQECWAASSYGVVFFSGSSKFLLGWTTWLQRFGAERPLHPIEPVVEASQPKRSYATCAGDVWRAEVGSHHLVRLSFRHMLTDYSVQREPCYFKKHWIIRIRNVIAICHMSAKYNVGSALLGFR